MRKLLIATALAAAGLAALPAAAQSYGERGYGYGYGQGRGIEQQLRELDWRITRAAERRTISWREANDLRRQADWVRRLHYRYRRDGLSQWEYRDLQNRIQNIRQRLRWERNDDWRGDGRYDRDDRYDRDRYRYRGRDDDDDDD